LLFDGAHGPSPSLARHSGQGQERHRDGRPAPVLIAADSKNDNTTTLTTGTAADSKNDNTTTLTTGTAADSKNDNTTEAPRTARDGRGQLAGQGQDQKNADALLHSGEAHPL
jgi:hypothetical protein